jgi:hypothetical protein
MSRETGGVKAAGSGFPWSPNKSKDQVRPADALLAGQPRGKQAECSRMLVSLGHRNELVQGTYDHDTANV